MKDEHDSREDEGEKRSWSTNGSSGEERLVEMMNPRCKRNEEESGIPGDG